ncbi:SDR family oxidoreductase [Altibacter sp. HG106]|uniref:SDR family oxidoreductase n=1 Tax=Altibacter sp. HG106 TaxID=3023937 RepID=UPI0023501358|nr:SDR family oxidoreductase [Altibacter sp. HG106]MDC7995108.1 SDR family oxidoreductase [Altibacter sp. HG106]
MIQHVAISGLGWLGLPLARRLMDTGYRVRGSVTQPDKAASFQQKGYRAFVLHAMESGLAGSPSEFLEGIDCYVVMIPPGLRKHSGVNYVAKMKHLLTEVVRQEIPHVIFISSTSVYGSDQGTVTEKTTPQPDSEAGKQLLETEQLWFQAPLKTTIVRFGGLIGGSRQPVRYLAGRTGLSNGNAPVNLIHRKDCLNILASIIQQEAFGHILNAVHPDHPSKEAYYVSKAKELGLTPPQYSEPSSTWMNKQVDSVLIPSELHYTFQHPI